MFIGRLLLLLLFTGERILPPAFLVIELGPLTIKQVLNHCATPLAFIIMFLICICLNLGPWNLQMQRVYCSFSLVLENLELSLSSLPLNCIPRRKGCTGVSTEAVGCRDSTSTRQNRVAESVTNERGSPHLKRQLPLGFCCDTDLGY